jgi:hypothetical protein
MPPVHPANRNTASAPELQEVPGIGPAEWLTESRKCLKYKLLIIKYLTEKGTIIPLVEKDSVLFVLNDVGRWGDDREKLREGLANEYYPEQRVEVQYG